MTNIITQKVNSSRGSTANFLLFSAGKFISVFGTAIYAFAIGLYVLRETGSGLSFAMTLAFSILPVVIFGPFSGVIADKLDKKKTIISMDILNGILFLSLFFVASRGGMSLPIIYASTFISTTLTTVFSTSLSSAMPRLVSEDKLIGLNSAGRIIDSSSSILAPILGGMIFALVDLRLFMVINALSFFASALLEVFINFNVNSENANVLRKEKVSFLADIKGGLKFILESCEIKRIIGILVAINFFLSLSVSVPMPYIINNVLGLSTKSFGIIESMFPLGIIFGALFVKKIIEKVPHQSIMRLTGIALSVCIGLIGLPFLLPAHLGESAYFVYYVVVMAAFGVIISLVDIPIIYRLQKTVPEDYRGRVMSIGISVSKIVQPAAFIVSGLLLDIISPLILIAAGGVLMLFSTVVILRERGKEKC
ncbi:MAG: MFS transporter [Clostridia bacterium]|nr:MFS transporter [Clostridia bacterium]